MSIAMSIDCVAQIRGRALSPPNATGNYVFIRWFSHLFVFLSHSETFVRVLFIAVAVVFDEK